MSVRLLCVCNVLDTFCLPICLHACVIALQSQAFRVEEQAAFKSLLMQLQDLMDDDNAAGADAFVAQVQRRRFVSWLLSGLRLR